MRDAAMKMLHDGHDCVECRIASAQRHRDEELALGGQARPRPGYVGALIGLASI